MQFTVEHRAKISAALKGYVRSEQHQLKLTLARRARPTRSMADRFWEKVKKGDPTECWPWTANALPRGYGLFMVERREKYAHRIAYELTHGPIPAGYFVCHACDTPACCNPSHLWIGTPADNAADMKNKGRVARGERHYSTKLTPEQYQQLLREYEALPHREGGYHMGAGALARRYGIAVKILSNLRRGVHWSQKGGL